MTIFVAHFSDLFEWFFEAREVVDVDSVDL